MSEKVEIIEFLSEEEETELEELESIGVRVSEVALQNAREFGRILTVIRNKGYFKKQRRRSEIKPFKNFDEYVKSRFNRGPSMGYNYIHVYNTMKLIDDVGVDASELGTIQNALNVCNEIKKLVKETNVPKNEIDNLVKEVIKQGINVAKNICPVDERDNALMNTESVQMAFKTVREIATTGMYEIDGRQIPMSLGRIALDEQASMALYEQVQRRRQESVDKFIQQKESRFLPKTVELKSIEQVSKEAPTIYTYCPVHGSQHGASLLKAGFKMACGCLGILESTEDNTRFVWYPGEAK